MKGRRIGKGRSVADRITQMVIDMSKVIRYTAIYQNGKLESLSRPNLGGASSWESDKYEEMIVNPTLVTLLRQRGEIDCGGLRHVIIQYGNLTQFVRPIRGGHISVAFELNSNYSRILPRIERLLKTEMLTVGQ